MTSKISNTRARKRTAGRLAAAVALAAAQGVAFGAPAYAVSDGVAKVSATGYLSYEAAGSVRNVIRVSAVAGAILVDDIVAIVPGRGCLHHTADRTVVRCTGATNGVSVYGYGGDDDITISVSTPWTQAFGGAGADLLWGGVGRDRLNGGPGDDVIDGGPGGDTIDGADGVDDLYGDTGDDHLNGGPGNDWLQGQEGRDFLSGEVGDDDLFGGPQDDALLGGAGYDYLDGGADDSSWGDNCTEGEELIGCES